MENPFAANPYHSQRKPRCSDSKTARKERIFPSMSSISTMRYGLNSDVIDGNESDSVSLGELTPVYSIDMWSCDYNTNYNNNANNTNEQALEIVDHIDSLSETDDFVALPLPPSKKDLNIKFINDRMNHKHNNKSHNNNNSNNGSNNSGNNNNSDDSKPESDTTISSLSRVNSNHSIGTIYTGMNNAYCNGYEPSPTVSTSANAGDMNEYLNGNDITDEDIKEEEKQSELGNNGAVNENNIILDNMAQITSKFDELFPFYRLSDKDCKKLSLLVYSQLDSICRIFCNSKGRVMQVKIYYYDENEPRIITYYNKFEADKQVCQWKNIIMDEQYCLKNLQTNINNLI